MKVEKEFFVQLYGVPSPVRIDHVSAVYYESFKVGIWPFQHKEHQIVVELIGGQKLCGYWTVQTVREIEEQRASIVRVLTAFLNK